MAQITSGQQRGIEFSYTPGQETFRRELRAFLTREVTPDLVEETKDWVFSRVPDRGVSEQLKEFGRKLGKRGWLALGYPREYGGGAGTYVDELILAEELANYRVIMPCITAVRSVGPIILRRGSEAQKNRFLPMIARGDIEFALGYTEPHAGTDLASLEMRAVDRGDYFSVNGHKIFNTCGHCAEYHWLGVRTAPELPKHKGISLLIVDLKSPGITIQPIYTMAEGRTNAIYYDDVRVPKENLVGTQNRGFEYMSEALEHERLFLISYAELKIILDDLVEHVRKTSWAGRPPAESAVLRSRIADLATAIEVARVLSYRAASMLDQGTIPLRESCEVKILATELAQRLAETGMQLLGLYGQLQKGSPRARLDGSMELAYRASVMPTFGAGSNEILRNVLAVRGLGLPRG